MPVFSQIKFSDMSNFYLEPVLDKSLYIYFFFFSVPKVMAPSKFLLENAFFPAQAEGEGRGWVCKTPSQPHSDLRFSSLQGEFSNAER